MFHLTCYGWLIFRARSAGQVGDLTARLFASFGPAAVDAQRLLVPLVLYVTPLLLVHALEAQYDDLLVVPKLPPLVRYSIYVLFGNFGGSEFIYFQF